MTEMKKFDGCGVTRKSNITGDEADKDKFLITFSEAARHHIYSTLRGKMYEQISEGNIEEGNALFESLVRCLLSYRTFDSHFIEYRHAADKWGDDNAITKYLLGRAIADKVECCETHMEVSEKHDLLKAVSQPIKTDQL